MSKIAYVLSWRFQNNSLGTLLQARNSNLAHCPQKPDLPKTTPFFLSPSYRACENSTSNFFLVNENTSLGTLLQTRFSIFAYCLGKIPFFRKFAPFCSARPCFAATSFKFPPPQVVGGNLRCCCSAGCRLRRILSFLFFFPPASSFSFPALFLRGSPASQFVLYPPASSFSSTPTS